MNIHETAKNAIENIAVLIFYGIVGVSMVVIIGYGQLFIFGSFGGMTNIIIEVWKATYSLIMIGVSCFIGWAAVSILFSVHKVGSKEDETQ